MNGGNFLISLVIAYLVHTRTDLTKIKSKAWTLSFIVFYFLIIVVARSYSLSNALKPSVLGSAFAGYYSHHHGIFLSIFLSRFILETKSVDSGKHRIVRIADKLFTTAFLSSLLILKLFISNTYVLLEMSFTNMVRSC